MQNKSIEKFKHYLENQKDDFLKDGRRIEGIIRDIFPENKSLANILMSAWKAGVVAELGRTTNVEVTIAQFADILSKEYSFKESYALAAVRLWAYVLKLTDVVPDIHGLITSYSISQTNITPETKLCPFCSEEIKKDARKCKHCHRDISDDAMVKGMRNEINEKKVGSEFSDNAILQVEVDARKQLLNKGFKVGKVKWIDVVKFEDELHVAYLTTNINGFDGWLYALLQKGKLTHYLYSDEPEEIAEFQVFIKMPFTEKKQCLRMKFKKFFNFTIPDNAISPKSKVRETSIAKIDPSAEQKTVKLYFYRPYKPIGILLKIEIFVNSKKLLDISNNSTEILKTSMTGELEIGIKALGYKVKTVKINAQLDKCYFFKVGFTLIGTEIKMVPYESVRSVFPNATG